MCTLMRLCFNRLPAKELKVPLFKSFNQTRNASILTAYHSSDQDTQKLSTQQTTREINFQYFKNQSLLLNAAGNVIAYDQRRFKSRGKGRGPSKKDSDDEGDDDDDDDEDIEEDDDIIKTDYKDLAIETGSMRIDVVLKTAMPLPRKKIEEAFAEDRVRLNDERISKKGVDISRGDVIDYIYGRNRENPEFLDVRRVQITALPEYKTAKDRVKYKIRRWPSLTVPNYVRHPFESNVLRPEEEERVKPVWKKD